ncbi:MAG: ATP-binding cassette domain-containing protein, partial [Deltaproteobacteria bacterium]|nr:ATP-binding cassette domain-containing protein [Deltaproteobacteria bacterium]MBW2530333.1 ATP-binding cassette domain-containing protein [Deltaproteobacteria bacterium]
WCTVRGAREHNLTGFDLQLPHGQLVVVTGVSGSGKSSLAFDTLFREGQRRYLESFSPRARQALGRLHRPEVDEIEGLPPALAVDQTAVVRSSRSTVGTLTGLYDHLRMLFARAGERGDRADSAQASAPLTSSLFSFNTPEGACPSCSGLGVVDRVDPDLLVADPARSLREGALVPTTPTGYIVYSQVTIDVLDTVCRAHGFDVDTPWEALSELQRKMVFFGSNKLRVPFGKHPLESRLRWKGITAKPREEGFYKGIVTTIEEIVKRTRNKNALRFVRTTSCRTCDGTRLSAAARDVTIAGRTIADVAGQPLDGLPGLLQELADRSGRPPIARALVAPMLERLELLDALGLGHLEIGRGSMTLSRGEAQRLRLATQAVVGLAGVLYVLDEPSIGLHSTDICRLHAVLRRLLDRGSSLVVVEHAPETIAMADWLVDVGPGPGERGGRLLYNAPPPWKCAEEAPPPSGAGTSATLAFALGQRRVSVSHRPRPAAAGAIRLLGVTANNLREVDVELQLGRLNAISGVSGAGKSTLVFEALVPGVDASQRRVPTVREIAVDHAIDSVIAVDQNPIGRTPRSNPATYTKVFDRIRDTFAAEPVARERGFDKSHFSLNVKGGRCEDCHGAGVQTVGMHFLGEVEVPCDRCGGWRFGPEVLEVTFRGRSIRDVLELSVSDARELFAEVGSITRVLDAMIGLGLGYLRLGQPSTTLSGGEAQRIKLATHLAKRARGHCLYVLDEPTVGLHQADVEVLIAALHGLVDAGHTVVVVEHDLDVLRAADWIVDLGPGGGAAGGTVVAVGPPAVIAEAEGSRTAQALRGDVREDGQAGREGAAAAVAADRGDLSLTGVRTNNLAGIDVAIPHDALTVVTGPSGSGKSSLVMDTIAEAGLTRFAEGLPAFARRFVAVGRRREVEAIRGLTPTIAIGPRRVRSSPRSTVGTMTGALDPLRLLFARVGERSCPRCGSGLDERGRCGGCAFVGLERLSASAFSFNHELGACPGCRGLGWRSTCDPERLISHPNRPLAGGAMDGHKSGRFYGDPDGQHMAILAAVGETMGIDFAPAWQELGEEAQRVALDGTGPRTYQVTWRFRRKGRQGEHRWTTTWRGLIAEVDDEYARKHADRRGESMRALLRDVRCPECDGARLSAEMRAVTYGGSTLPDLLALPVATLQRELDQLDRAAADGAAATVAARAALAETSRRLAALAEVGLCYLPLDRRAADLSAGEAARVRLAGQLNAGLCHVTYLFDEPTRGLHPRDTARLVQSLRQLRDEGNTVILVEHDLEVVAAADHAIELGPGGGEQGGQLLFSGSVEALRSAEDTATGRWLSMERSRPQARAPRPLREGLVVERPGAKNLRAERIAVPSGGLVVVTGVSGSGKSTLLFDVIEPSVRTGRPVGCAAVRGGDAFDAVHPVDQSTIAGGELSTPATVAGVFDAIRAEFARTDEAKARRYGKARFSFAGKSGGCKACGGHGRERVEMGFLPPLWLECSACHGSRYDEETLAVRARGRTIAEVLAMSFAQAGEHFAGAGDLGAKLELLCDVGLGYLRLGQPSRSLSGGEAQRLRLATELLRARSGRRALYLLDEPTTGLHAQEVADLLGLLAKLVEQGHTVLAIEHDLQVMAAADWLIDLGPEGGEGGGLVVDQGHPHEVAGRALGPTGLALRGAEPLE